MSRRIECPANQWTTIFNHAFVQFPQSWQVTFTSIDGTPLDGEILEQRSAWIFPQTPQSLPLQATMIFQRGWWNTFYRLQVKPTHDVIAEID